MRIEPDFYHCELCEMLTAIPGGVCESCQSVKPMFDKLVDRITRLEAIVLSPTVDEHLRVVKADLRRKKLPESRR